MPIKDKNRFRVQVWKGRLTYYFNGTKIAEVEPNSGVVGEWEQARIGVCCQDARWGAMYRVGNVRARLLTNPPQAPDPKELVAE